MAALLNACMVESGWRWLAVSASCCLVQVHSELLRVASLLDGGPQPAAAAAASYFKYGDTGSQLHSAWRLVEGRVVGLCALLVVAKSGLVGANAAGACMCVCVWLHLRLFCGSVFGTEAASAAAAPGAAVAEFKLPAKPLELWSSQELAAWMASLGGAYREYAVKLIDIDVSGAESVEYFQSEASWTTQLGVPAGLQVL